MKDKHQLIAEHEPETAVLVGLILEKQKEETVIEYLDELEFLAKTAGAITKKRFMQRLATPHNKTFVGSGKLAEIKAFVDEACIDIVIFDDELSPSQIRNIEKALEVKILDRSSLILDIFASHARTAHAKTQVELAQYQYLLPRLTRMWTHLDRIKGGIGMRGAGETQIETDRRIVNEKIAGLRKKLEVIDKQMAQQRGNRGQLVRVSLVGYTNVGKSTIMNRMSKSEVYADNKLFATLDTTVRKVVLGNLPFLLSDTVGFIRKLPHQLVESFKSTLDEVRESDILLHVLDLAHKNFEDHYKVVSETLQEIGAANKPTIIVFNKIDAYKPDESYEDEDGNIVEEQVSIEDLKKQWIAKLDDSQCVFISAYANQNMDELRDMLYEQVKEVFKVRYPYNNFLY